MNYLSDTPSMKIRMKPLALLVSLLASGQAAAVQNGNVTGGDASITQNGAITTIQQHSDRAIVAWGNFDVGPGERVNIQQPNAHAAILNRVVGTTRATQIQGALDANGRVFVINPDGIVVGQQGTINANSVVLSTVNLPDSDFMGAASFYLSSPGKSDDIRNDGVITAPQGAILFGHHVVNGPTGQITAERGSVSLVAAQQAQINLWPDGSIGMPMLGGSQTNGLAANDGHITAGAVLMQAVDSSNVSAAIVRNTGTIEARGMDGLTGGSVTLQAGAGTNATVDLRGTISANQIYAVSTGDLNVDGAALHASTESLSGLNITVGNGGLEFLGTLSLSGPIFNGRFTQNGDITSAQGSIIAQGLGLFAQEAGTTTLIGGDLTINGTRATLDGALAAQNVNVLTDQLDIARHGVIDATNVTLNGYRQTNIAGRVAAVSSLSITGQQGLTQTAEASLRFGDAMTISPWGTVTLNGTIDAGSWYTVSGSRFAAGVYQPGQGYGGANALPALTRGGVITSGAGSITQNGDTTNVAQTSDKLIIDWLDFNIAANQSIHFLQPNANAAVLNKISGFGRTTIDGALNANGRVFILNPYGIVIGPTGTLNANSVTLAAGSILSDEDFLKGDTWRVDVLGGPGQQGLVQNHGTIATKTGVTLIGNEVLNLTSGRITTGKGNLSMVAAGTVQVSQNTDGSVRKVDALTSTNNAHVANDGRITVDNGYAQLEAYTNTPNQGELVRSLGQIDALNRSGDVSAPGEWSAGNVFITGRSRDESSGTVNIRGRLDGQNITVHSDGDLNLYSAALTTWQRGADPSHQKVTLEGNRIIVGPQGLTIDGSAVLRGVGNAPVFDKQGPFTVIGDDVSLIDLDLKY